MKRNNKSIGKPAFFIVTILVLAFSFAAFFGISDYYGDTRKVYIKGTEDIRWGIDISGGVEAIFSPDKEESEITDEDMDSAKSIIETRLVGKNITDYEVYTDYDSHQLIVRFPWQSDDDSYDPTAAINELGETAMLTFYKGQTNTGDVVLQGSDDIESASPGYDQENGYVVQLRLTEAGKQKFAKATAEQLNDYISIYMDDTLLSAPQVNSVISDGNAIITGMEDANAAKDLATKINAGSLPFALTVDDSKLQVISPVLGEQALRVMLIAGIVAFALICVLMIFRYRLPGVIACIALFGQAAGMIACISGFFPGIPSFTMTLPGIAGIILSIGFGVDANVISAERIKEEFKKGKTIDGAVSQGFSNAFSSILDGNLTNVIVAVVLLAAFGTPDSALSKAFNFIFPFLSASVTGNIYSFGYTLITGVIFNFIMGVTASRYMLCGISRFKFFRKPWMYCSAPKKERKEFDFVKFFKKSLCITGCILIVGIVFTCIRGVKSDITFAGGSRFTYSFEGDINADDAANTVNEKLGVKPVVTQNSDFSGNSKKLVLTFSGDITAEADAEKLKSLLATASDDSSTDGTDSSDTSTDANSEKMIEVQTALTKILTDAYPDNTVKLNESNTVNPTLASSFFIKSIVAVLFAAVFVVLYIGIRFRKIGGVSAGVFSFVALLHDIIVAFFVMTIFGLELDTNFFAVVLTLLGYSLNDTIVIFDRIRENKKFFPTLSVRENVNKSINETLARSVMTAVTTFVAIIAVVAVAEFFGVTALRSFVLPMAFGIISGCYSSVFISGPLWVVWSETKAKKQSKSSVK